MNRFTSRRFLPTPEITADLGGPVRSIRQAALLAALMTGAGLLARRRSEPVLLPLPVAVPQQRVSPLAALGLLTEDPELADVPELSADEDALLAALDWRASA